MLAKLIILASFLFAMTSSTYCMAADELVGEYIYIETFHSSPGVSVYHTYPAFLWIRDDGDAYIDYMLQLNISETEVEYYPIEYIDDTQMYFDRDGKMFVFYDLLHCGGHLKACGHVVSFIGGLWQLWEKPAR